MNEYANIINSILQAICMSLRKYRQEQEGFFENNENSVNLELRSVR